MRSTRKISALANEEELPFSAPVRASDAGLRRLIRPVSETEPPCSREKAGPSSAGGKTASRSATTWLAEGGSCSTAWHTDSAQPVTVSATDARVLPSLTMGHPLETACPNRICRRRLTTRNNLSIEQRDADPSTNWSLVSH